MMSAVKGTALQSPASRSLVRLPVAGALSAANRRQFAACHSSLPLASAPRHVAGPLLGRASRPLLCCHVNGRSGGHEADEPSPTGSSQNAQGSRATRLLSALAKTVGAVALFTVVSWAGATRPSYAATGSQFRTAADAAPSARSSSDPDSTGASTSHHSSDRGRPDAATAAHSYRYAGFDLADSGAAAYAAEGDDRGATGQSSTSGGASASHAGSDYQGWYADQRARYVSRHPELAGHPEEVDANLRELMWSGAPAGFEGLALSRTLYEDSEEPPAPRGKAASALQYGEMAPAEFSSEDPDEAVVGADASLHYSNRLTSSLPVVPYQQLWRMVGQDRVAQVKFYGADMQNMLVMTREESVGGVRSFRVLDLPSDPELLDHLVAHAVIIDSGTAEGNRLAQAWFAQVLTYVFPFFCLSAAFWHVHSWLLDPQPNGFKRREYVRFKRETMETASRLNFRSPARLVSIDSTAPDFIAWDDINGIDSVKDEIAEIIEYLKNPALMKQRGVNRIGGVLLAGAPGTGKTLLAKAIAAESGVQMYSCSGTDFFDSYSGVGARRIRETFEKLRNSAPAILFVDEFDALGGARGGSAATGGEESANIINELLVQMDGFEDNRGIVVLGATNRPGAIDSALVRPGRFDRIVYMPLPDAAGRAQILKVHARGRAVDPAINWTEVARAMAGFTGADCMGLMARAGRMAGLQGREVLQEADLYAAMENKAVEGYFETTRSPRPGVDGGVPNPIPPELRKAIAVYEAGKALAAYITPEYEEIARVSICPGGLIMGYTLLVEDEAKTADSIMTRGDMEGVMVVHMAGRCAEKLIMGERELTSLGAPDLFHANHIAREMILECGMGRRMGPMDLMHVIPKLGQASMPREGEEQFHNSTDMSTEQARVAMREVSELLESAEAKAYYGMATNWAPLQALTQELLDRGTMTGKDVALLLERNGVVHFQDPFLVGYGWDTAGNLQYPYKIARPLTEGGGPAETPAEPQVLTGIAAKTWDAGTGRDVPRGPDGKFLMGWHYNSPWAVRTDLSEEFLKDKERYGY